MSGRRARVAEILRAIVHEVRTEKLTFLAGSIAYHAFLSILPLLLLLLTIVQRTENVALSDSIVRIMEAVLTEQASGVIQQGLAEADASVSVLGVAFLVWGALRIFRGLDTAFSDIYESEAENSFADQIGDGLLLLVTVALAVVATSLLGRLVALDGGGPGLALARVAATVLGLFVVFYPMYYVFPDLDVGVVEVVPGAAFAAVGVTVAQALFTTFKAGGTGGNIIASILVLLTWLYVIGLVVLLGAAINAVLSNRSNDVDITPVLGGVPRRKGESVDSIDRAELVADLEALEAAVDATLGTMVVELGGERFVLDGPQRASIEQATAVFGLDTSVALTLRWWPNEGE
ncbi:MULTISPECIES: YihY/virulence factor BrkB family protein [Haloarcula]|uniref:YihY/virulence factor BrkB family protein n=1 Tax=Haloarcula TaxID=2237 RepID=UPI0023EBA37C|nr:YihY/virulence factor BrkB family protein [Halomicroarcula sp. XH51]